MFKIPSNLCKIYARAIAKYQDLAVPGGLSYSEHDWSVIWTRGINERIITERQAYEAIFAHWIWWHHSDNANGGGTLDIADDGDVYRMSNDLRSSSWKEDPVSAIAELHGVEV